VGGSHPSSAGKSKGGKLLHVDISILFFLLVFAH
jgi:hypothetical protein